MRPTLTRHLLAWTLGALALVWASFIAFGWRTGEHEADELTDGHLASVSALLLAYTPGEFGMREAPVRPAGQELKAHDYQQSLSVVMWDATGRVLTRTGDAPPPRFDAASEGFYTLALGEPATHWRVFTRWNADRTRKVMVLLSLREREELAEDIAGQIVEPGLWLLPAVALVLGLAVMRGLRPLLQMTRDVHAMDIHRAEPLAAPRHEELASVVEAVNRLAARYHAALTRERDLANEFAHELRTPIAAIALQARALGQTQSGPERDAAAAHLEQQALRAGEVLSHLLALARASRAELDEAAEEVDLAGIARDLVARFAPAAHDGGRELSLDAPQPLRVTGHPLLLELALRNLIENALSHSPAGSQVEVRVDAPGRYVEVRDWLPQEANAPSPAEDGLSLGMGLGLGLGHRVVEKIAAIHQARFERPARKGSPRRYRIAF